MQDQAGPGNSAVPFYFITEGIIAELHANRLCQLTDNTQHVKTFQCDPLHPGSNGLKRLLKPEAWSSKLSDYKISNSFDTQCRCHLLSIQWMHFGNRWAIFCSLQRKFHAQGLTEKELKAEFRSFWFEALGMLDNITINSCLHPSQAFGGNSADNWSAPIQMQVKECQVTSKNKPC